MSARTTGRGWWLVAAMTLACGLSSVPRADDKQSSSSSSSSSAVSTDDSDLFEFLGSVGSEDDAWLSYLAHTDPTKVATAPHSPPPPTGGKQDD